MQESTNEMSGKSLVCFTNDFWSSALSEIRLKAPLRECNFNVIQGNNFGKLLIDDFSKADFVVIQRDFPIYLDIFYHVLNQINKYKLPLVYEIDDNLFDLPQDHPDLQTDCYSKRFIPMLWAISKADAVTASTAPLANVLRALNSNVHVLPNYLINNYWRFLPAKKDKNTQEEVVVGYIGGTTHAADLKAIVKSLQSIGHQYGDRVKFKFWGEKPPEGLLSHPKVEWQPVVQSYQEYALTFQSQKIDILVAPLTNHAFSQSKSHLKFLEYSTLGVPGIYSDVLPYRQVVNHGKNGFLATSHDEWVNCLQTLISSPALRYQVALNAQKTVRRDWLLSENAYRWSGLYNKVRSGALKSQRQLNESSPTRNEILFKILSRQTNQIEKLVKKEQLLEEKDTEIRGPNEANVEIEQRLQALINSRSWRMTAPLRWLSHSIRRLR